MEIVVILGIALLLFGKRLPEVGRSLGRGIIEFKKGIKGIEDDIEEESSHPTRLPPADSTGSDSNRSDSNRSDSNGDEYQVFPRDVPNEGDAEEREARSDDLQKKDAPAESSGETK